MKPKIAELERAQGQVEPLAYIAPEIAASIPALLRIALAAKEVSDDTYEFAGEWNMPTDADEALREALDAFDWD